MKQSIIEWQKFVNLSRMVHNVINNIYDWSYIKKPDLSENKILVIQLNELNFIRLTSDDGNIININVYEIIYTFPITERLIATGITSVDGQSGRMLQLIK